LAITNHGLFSQNASEELFDWYLKTIGRWTFNSADVVFCYTEADEERLREYGVSTDVAVVPNGIDTERFTPEGATSELIEHQGVVVLFVGRLVDGKRPQDALEAVNEMPDDMNAKCYFVGDGPMFDKLVARGGASAEFLGHLPYDEMPAVYRAADVLLLPSRAEGFPRTVLEAFASGLPTVSSRLPHTAPMIEQAGETVPVGDVEGYTAALMRVLNEADSLGGRGRELVVEESRWQDTVAETTTTLQSLAKPNR
jgi:glycosyltransferase involved in cell wall biosynthesis